MISTKTEEVLEQALIRVAAAGNGNLKEEVLVHLVSDERCFSALATPASHPVQDLTQDCVDLLAQQEVLAKPDADAQNQNQIQNHQTGTGLRPNFSLPSVVIHGASSSSSAASMSPKTNKKKKKKSKGDEVTSGSISARSQSFHVRSPCKIPLLKLPDDFDDDDGGDPSLNIPPPIHIEAATSDEGESVDAEEMKNVTRKRRKSLVNLLFSSSSKSESPTCPNSLDAGMSPHGGQRLHFRRLSDIICRLGGNKDEEKQVLNTQTSKDDSDLGNMDSPSGMGSSGSAGLTLRQLFPYRRRRSSVSHLDHTDQVSMSHKKIIRL
jgi:hypothetical protein